MNNNEAIKLARRNTITKDDLARVNAKGDEVIATIAAMRQVALRIETAVLDFENKKLEVMQAIATQGNLTLKEINQDKLAAIKEINLARDEAIKAIYTAPNINPNAADKPEYQKPQNLGNK